MWPCLPAIGFFEPKNAIIQNPTPIKLNSSLKNQGIIIKIKKNNNNNENYYHFINETISWKTKSYCSFARVHHACQAGDY